MHQYPRMVARWVVVISLATIMVACGKQEPEINREEAVERALQALTQHLGEGSPPESWATDDFSSGEHESRTAAFSPVSEKPREPDWVDICAENETEYLRMMWKGYDIPASEVPYRLRDAQGRMLAEGVSSECGDTSLLESEVPEGMVAEMLPASQLDGSED